MLVLLNLVRFIILKSCVLRLTSLLNLIAKERSGFGGGGFDDDAKFAGNWRRDGPLPDIPSREGSRRRFDGPPGERPGPPPSVSDNIDQWRSSRPSPRLPPAELDPSLERRRPSFQPASGLADTEEVWSKGSKFKPAEEASKLNSARRGDLPPRETPPSVSDAGDWRGSRAGKLNSTSRLLIFLSCCC